MAAKVAAYVAGQYRRRVNFKDQSSFDAWLDLVLPKIFEGHEKSADLGVRFANDMRELELPDLRDGFKFEPITSINRAQLATSLAVVGPVRQNKKADEIAQMDISPIMEKAMLTQAKRDAEKEVAGATLRHVQNGGRRSVENGISEDKVALGYVRVTRENPCFFCAMLASRGLEYGVYGEDSFDRSDARFVGPGDAKVHDRCQCSLKPVYRPDDEVLADNARFEAMWYDLSGQGDADPMTNFRRNYEGRPITKS
jgi:hypothetical protein